MRIPARLMQHRCTVALPGRSGSHGGTWGPPVGRRCYTEDKTQVVVNNLGKQETSNTMVVLDPDVDVRVDAHVTVWVGSPQERTGKVISIARYDDRQAPSHLVVYLD